MNLGGGVHLTYCSNIHPGESWPEVRANLERHVVAVRDRLGHPGPFGVGLRLSARAAAELAEPAALADCRALLARERLYVFTINGFPYGTFHGSRVKEEVYLPDWRDPERLRYTNALADLLAVLLADAPVPDPGLTGSVSTVPGAYKAALDGPGDVSAMVDHLLQHVAHLVTLRARGGRPIALALEPEPDCFLETIDEVVDFFGRELHSPAAARRLAALGGLDREAAAAALHEHLGVCLDLCHAAVEYESAAEAVVRLRAAGIAVPKMQISAGLRVPAVDGAALAALRRFDDPVYLHQTVERGVGGLRRYPDLPQALAAHAARASAVPEHEWRVHFHVPIFLDRLPPFGSTQDFIREALALQRAQVVSPHLEVETYTWDVLPDHLKTGDITDYVVNELEWVKSELT